MDAILQADVLDRLERDSSVREHIANLVVAALVGEIDAALAGKTITPPAAKKRHASEPLRIFVESIAVEGFRGIGPKATLSFRPGPGLTLVVGRNGSGKSSFSEALELLLTGDNQRWSARRTKVWKEGWRNLHHPVGTHIEAKLAIDGQADGYTVRRGWKPDENIEDGSTTVQHKGKSATLDSLEWEHPLATYRPFLSYNELSSMLEEGPSKLFDALASILGLEDLITAADTLRETRTTRTKIHKAISDRLEEIRSMLAAITDERAAQSLEALAGKNWDLERIAVLTGSSHGAEEDSETRRLRELANLQGPDPARVQAAVNALRSSVAYLQKIAQTDAGKARRRAEILEKALELHQHDGVTDCPICGKARALDEKWSKQAAEEIQKLRTEGEDLEAAQRNLLQAERSARQWITSPPASVEDPDLLKLWNAWKTGAAKTGIELAAHLESQGALLDRAIQEIRTKAQAELARREDQWRPAAQALSEWLPGARRMMTEFPAMVSLKAAEDWLRSVATRIHNERFEPIQERVKRIWELLRTKSHVELESVSFQGKSTARRVSLDVSVDGKKGSALSVMSQGELHSLALSLFLPRATLEFSPFRFLMIDDPVQSMDTARVEGLARVLELVTKKRQVAIFTHDDRLREAIDRLKIPVDVREVLRKAGSVVEVR